MSAALDGLQAVSLDTSAELVRIAASTGSTRSVLIGDFLLRRNSLVRQIAYRLCSANRLDSARYLDDLIGEVHIEAVKMFAVMAHDATIWHNWEGMLTTRARNAISARMSSPEWTGISGDIAANRRQRLVYATQRELLGQTGVLYEGQDLIDRHNTRMRRARVDADRQSVVATIADLVGVQVLSFGDTDGIVFPAVAPVIDESDCPLVPAEALALIALSCERCWATSEHLGQVADLFLGADGREQVTNRSEIAATLGITRDMARRAVHTVQGIARDVAADRFGITAA